MDGTSILVAEARAAAKAAGLRYASDEQPGIRRKGVGKGFRYLDAEGKAAAKSSICSYFPSSRTARKSA